MSKEIFGPLPHHRTTEVPPVTRETMKNIPMFFDYCEEVPQLEGKILIYSQTLEDLFQNLENLTEN